MTEDAALKLVEEREGRLCIRFYQREDGTVLTSDCPAGAGRPRPGTYVGRLEGDPLLVRISQHEPARIDSRTPT